MRIEQMDDHMDLPHVEATDCTPLPPHPADKHTLTKRVRTPGGVIVNILSGPHSIADAFYPDPRDDDKRAQLALAISNLLDERLAE